MFTAYMGTVLMEGFSENIPATEKCRVFMNSEVEISKFISLNNICTSYIGKYGMPNQLERVVACLVSLNTRIRNE